jgi:hypothetical protein
MNLDDFIVTDNVATPAGITFPQSQEALKRAEDRSSHSVTSAIPIKSRKEPARNFVPQSVPAPASRQRVQDEFGYVTRHPRKTSIDERRVCDCLPRPVLLHGSDYWLAFCFKLLTNINLDSKASSQLFTSRTGCQ